MQQTELQCLNCARSEAEVPLVQLRFHSRAAHVCPQCLPLLIHHPERLAEKIAEMATRADPDGRKL